MKPVQTVLLLVLIIAIVFGVTFASMYVSRSAPPTPRKKEKEAPANTALHLTFPVRVFPPDSSDPTRRIATEYGQMGEYDFWFENPNDEEVRLGLLKRSCRLCTEVKLFVAPATWHPALAAGAVALLGQSAVGELASVLASTGFIQKRDSLASEARNGRTLEEGLEEGLPIPPRAFGFVRLSWEARRGTIPGPRFEKYGAELWWQDPRAGGGVTVAANNFFIDGLRLDATDVSAGRLGAGDSAERVVRLWSSTRYHLDEPEITSTGSPFVTCARPEPLTEEDYRALMRWGGEVRSGYRLLLTVKERLPDGSRFDEGAFLHQIHIKPREKILLPDPLEVSVRGEVRGDISLIGADTGIVLEPFPVRIGTRHQISLRTERPDLNLKLDRVPDFMKAHLSESKKDSGGRQTWVLTVAIEPNQVSGTFPRRDSEVYRDTAVYLRIEGAAKRRLRIPVSGNATQ